ncbi:hypothetical protein J1N35_024349 [Gossypium stocksii]|uniref:RNase H type-1 domain-containing protein n=1 Tax=Gossypium stocksii TaxID=47602 RepID=A0A9D3V5F0_9ROSI|nr:hypothetical protein J1N35_024349 [Gossypium stocksii]
MVHLKQSYMLLEIVRFPGQFGIQLFQFIDRNMFVFSNSHSSIQDVVDTGISWMRIYSPPSMAMFHSNSMASDSKWLAPESSWVKLNTDCAVLASAHSAAVGGVIRDADGNWLCGYSMALGKD